MLLPALLSAALLPMQGQKQGSDYVLHIRHLDADGTGQVKSYTYYDGLGRPYETVKRGYTPTGKDLVQSNELDASGRVHKAVLPVSRPGSGGETGSTEAETLSSSQHGDSRGYTEYTYDALDRPLSVYGPGEAWHTSDHKQTYTYLTNKSGDALLDARLYESDLGGNLKNRRRVIGRASVRVGPWREPEEERELRVGRTLRDETGGRGRAHPL